MEEINEVVEYEYNSNNKGFYLPDEPAFIAGLIQAFTLDFLTIMTDI